MSESTTGPTPAPSAPAAPAPGQITESAPPPVREISVDQAAKMLGEERRARARQAANGANGANGADAPPAAAPGRQDGGEAGEGRSLYERLNEELAGERKAAPAAGPTQDGGEHAAPATPSEITLTINGTPQRFTPQQLEEHYHKAAGFTQRMQELAAKERELREIQTEIERARPVLIPEMQRQLAELSAGIPDNLDWVRLRQEDPAKYDELVALKLNLEQQQRNLSVLNQQQQAEQQRRVQQALEAGHRKIGEVLPLWNDPQERTRISRDLSAWAREQGFSQQELDSVIDPRQILVMLKALAFENNQRAVRANGHAPAVPQVRRGTPLPPAARGVDADIQAQRERLQQSGQANDAARLLTLERAAAAARRGRQA